MSKCRSISFFAVLFGSLGIIEYMERIVVRIFRVDAVASCRRPGVGAVVHGWIESMMRVPSSLAPSLWKMPEIAQPAGDADLTFFL